MWLFLSGVAVGIILTIIVVAIFTAMIGRTIDEVYDDDTKY